LGTGAVKVSGEQQHFYLSLFQRSVATMIDFHILEGGGDPGGCGGNAQLAKYPHQPGLTPLNDKCMSLMIYNHGNLLTRIYGHVTISNAIFYKNTSTVTVGYQNF